MLEKVNEKQIKLFLKALGFEVIKQGTSLYSSNESGLPDILAHYYNLKLAIEVKRFKGSKQIKRQQIYQLNRYRLMGYHPFIISSESQFEKFKEYIVTLKEKYENNLRL